VVGREATVDQGERQRRNGRAVIAVASPVDRQRVQEILEPRMDVRIVGSLTEAAELVRAGSVDLVLLDIDDRLPQRQIEAASEQLPVLALADGDREWDAAKALELGVTDYVLRPLRPIELMARVERALRMARERTFFRALADTDALTGLANFRALSQRLDQEIRRSVRYGYPIALVMFDLDNLKQLNDGFGHEEGNRAIVALSEHLKKNLRDADFAARFGGDEFTVILPYQTEHDAAVFAERVRQGVASIRLALASDQLASFQLSISAGVTALHLEGDVPSPEELLARADSALYEAKRQGRNRVRVAPVTHSKRDDEGVAHHA
jgi:two-component system, cell cycle response regulator